MAETGTLTSDIVDDEAFTYIQTEQVPDKEAKPYLRSQVPSFMTHQADQSIFSLLFKGHLSL